MERLKKERQTLETAASKLLSAALKAGAEAAEVCATYGVQTKMALEKQDFHLASTDDGYNLGLRVVTGGKQGFSSTNSAEAADLKEVASKAVEILQFSPENPYVAIAPSENVSKETPGVLWDDALFDLSLQTQKDWTKVMADEGTRDPRFRLNDGAVSISAGLYLILNSHGTHKLEKETSLSWSVMGMGVDGDKITSFDYFSQLMRSAQGAPDKISTTTRKFRDFILSTLKSGPAKSYKGLVAFSPRAVLDILVSGLNGHLNGRSVAEGTSRWKIGDLGTSKFNPLFTLRDLPWFTDRFGSAFFDREGTPTADRTIIHQGRLESFFLDHYAAKALKSTSTGHALGGPTTPPSVGAHCLCVSPGDEPLVSITRKITHSQKEFLLVHRFSGQVDPITGDFSGVAKGGEWWFSGERAYFVSETLISGNIFDVLGDQLYALSKETEVVDSHGESPTLIADGVSVTAPGPKTV